MDEQTGPERAPTEAEKLSALQAEVADLRRQLEDQRLAQELREAFTLAAIAGTIAPPVTHSRLLRMIVETAVDVIEARAGSLLLVDQSTNELVFEVATGPKAESEVKRFRVPLGHGVAGLVALTGQPMAISDTASDARDAADIAEAIGYVPKNILCVPLFYDDRVIGVLELLDKEGEGAYFSAADMEALGLFANQAAVAIEQSRSYQNLMALTGEALASIGGLPDEQRRELRQRMTGFVAHLEDEVAYRQTLELAGLVREIAQRGELELRTCRAILENFAEYLRARPEPLGTPWTTP